MSGYDRALTVFSPDGHLFQVEYAEEAVRKGTLAVGVRGSDLIVLAVEKKSIAALQDEETARKIVKIENNICLAFAGLTADARILVSIACVQAQNYKLTYDEDVPIDYIARYIASTQQRYTQSGGSRPFGISTLVIGFGHDNLPRLYLTEPAGTYSQWKATAIGRNSKQVREYLQKNYTETSGQATIKLAVQALMEAIEAGSKRLELAVVDKNGLKFLTDSEVDGVVKEIEDHRQAAEAQRKARTQAAPQ